MFSQQRRCLSQSGARKANGETVINSNWQSFPILKNFQNCTHVSQEAGFQNIGRLQPPNTHTHTLIRLVFYQFSFSEESPSKSTTKLYYSEKHSNSCASCWLIKRIGESWCWKEPWGSPHIRLFTPGMET